jgi:predicted Zn finger-like uncharacterized protein
MLFTRCTHCDAWLRLSAAQLRIALGQVRCGSCLQIFNALARLDEDGPGEEVLSEESANLNTGNAPRREDEDIALAGSIGSASAGESAPKDERPRRTLAGAFVLIEDTVATGSPDEEMVAAPVNPTTDGEVGADSPKICEGAVGEGTRHSHAHDFDFDSPAPEALASIADDGRGPSVPLDYREAIEPSGVDTLIGHQREAGDCEGDTDGNGDSPTETQDGSNGQAFSGPQGFSDPWEEASRPLRDAPSEQAEESLPDLASVKGPDSASRRLSTSPPDIVTTDNATHTTITTGQDGEKPAPIAPDTESVPDILRADLERIERERNPWRMVGLFVLGIVLLIGLAAQWVWFNPDRSIRQYPMFAVPVARFCAFAGCSLATLDDRTLLRLVSREVRIHPMFEGALEVTAVLVNDGTRDQSFPALRFILFNVNGDIIAARRFLPAEYLGEQYIPDLPIKASQTATIRLDLIAPEDAAVSFEFEFI